MSMHCSFPRRALLRIAAYLSIVFPAAIVRTGYAASNREPIQQPLEPGDQEFINRAFEMKRIAVSNGDQAYGAVVVNGDTIVGHSPSVVIVNNDPTGHAELAAIRDAAARLGSRDLNGCTLYSSSHPCPMCEAAAYWAGIDRMVHGEAVTDAGAPTLCR